MDSPDLQPIIQSLNENAYQKAHSLIDQAGQNQPANARLVHLRALAFMGEHEYEKAFEEAGLSIELDEQFAPAYEIAGEAAWALGRLQLAQQQFETGLQNCGHSATSVLSKYAMFLSIERGAKLAKENIAKAVSHAPQQADTWVAAAWFNLGRQDWRTIVTDLDKALAIEPDHIHALNLKVYLLHRAEQQDQAKALAKQLSKLEGRDIRAQDVADTLVKFIDQRDAKIFAGFVTHPETSRLFTVLAIVSGLLLLASVFWAIADFNFSSGTFLLLVGALFVFSLERLVR